MKMHYMPVCVEASGLLDDKGMNLRAEVLLAYFILFLKHLVLNSCILSLAAIKQALL